MRGVSSGNCSAPGRQGQGPFAWRTPCAEFCFHAFRLRQDGGNDARRQKEHAAAAPVSKTPPRRPSLRQRRSTSTGTSGSGGRGRRSKTKSVRHWSGLRLLAAEAVLIRAGRCARHRPRLWRHSLLPARDASAPFRPMGAARERLRRFHAICFRKRARGATAARISGSAPPVLALRRSSRSALARWRARTMHQGTTHQGARTV